MAGQPDCLCRAPDGSYIVWDWKRCAQIKTDARRQMQPPLDHLPDCNWFHYCLQLNLYAYMLESEYDGIRVSGMFLGVAHPTAQPRVIEVPRLDAEMRALVDHEICSGRASEPILGESAPFVLI